MAYEGPLVHVDWEIRPDEWDDLRAVLLERQDVEFVRKLVADGALG